METRRFHRLPAIQEHTRHACAKKLLVSAQLERSIFIRFREEERGNISVPAVCGRVDMCMRLRNCGFTTDKSTRNSAIADKPRDAFVQYAMTWLT